MEDEPFLLEMLAEELADAGLDVGAAPGAGAALEAAGASAAAGGPPGVLVTDLALGAGMDGLALEAEARRRWPGIGVVLITAYPSRLNGREPGAREVCLVKPFGSPRLVAAVNGMMGRPGR